MLKGANNYGKNKIKKKFEELSIQATDFVRNHWKGLLVLGGIITTAVFLSSRDNEVFDMNFSNRWLKNATDDELASARESVRERYTTDDINEAGKIYNTLHRFDIEMIKRDNEKYEKEHPDSEPVYREHGWYLPSDD